MNNFSRNAYPPSLTSKYPSIVNEPILLYQGPADLVVHGKAIASEVTIRFNLLHPQGPEVVCSTMFGTPDAATELQVASENLVTSISGRQFRVGEDGSRFVGILNGDVELGIRSNLHRLQFHLANMPSVLGSWVTQGDRASRARISLEDQTWRVDVDAVPEAFGVTPLAEHINDVGGFAITHAGELRRIDGGTFTVEDGQTVLRDVRRTLSFARAGWASPFLLEGNDSAGGTIWRSWSRLPSAPFCTTAQWFSSFDPAILNSIFAGWRRIMATPQGNTINAALHLYLDAHQHGLTVESRLVLVQAALEGLADGWPHPPPIGAPSLAALSGEAAKRLATVGLSLGLDLSVPSGLTNLAALAKPNATSTVFERMTWMRNSVVHLNNFARLKGVSSKAKYEATQFAFWVLELALLRLLDADGKICNRLTAKTEGDLMGLPWKP